MLLEKWKPKTDLRYSTFPYISLEQTLLIWIVPPSNYPHIISHYADEIGYSRVSQHFYSSQHKFRCPYPAASTVPSVVHSPSNHWHTYRIIIPYKRGQNPFLLRWVRAKISLQLTALAVACVKKVNYTQVHHLAWESRNTSPAPVCVCVCERSNGCSVRIWKTCSDCKGYTNAVLVNAAINLLRSCLFLSQPKKNLHISSPCLQ